MVDINDQIPVTNLNTLLENLEDEFRCVYPHAGLLDLYEPEILSKAEYEKLEFKKYGYAVINDNNKL